MAGTFDFVLYDGEDFDRTLTWSTSNVPVSQGGTPVDLTNYTASLTLGTETGFITTTSTANGVINLGGVTGTIELYIPEAIAAQFVRTNVIYRLFLTSTETRCLLAGLFGVRA